MNFHTKLQRYFRLRNEQEFEYVHAISNSFDV